MTTQFLLTDDYIELIKLLKVLGIAETGGHAKMIVEAGIVKVNSAIELRKRAKLRCGDVVEVEGQKIKVTCKILKK